MPEKRIHRKIDRKIYAVFISVIAIALINAVISAYTIRQSQNITGTIVYNVNPSLNALERMNLMVTRSKMLMTNWVYRPYNQSDKDSLKNLNNIEYLRLRGRLESLTPGWQRKEHVGAINKIFSDYDQIAGYQAAIMARLNSFDDYQNPVNKFEAEDILEREIIPRSEEIINSLRLISQQQNAMAQDKQDEMLKYFQNLLIIVPGIALLIICMVLFSGYVITRSFIIPILQVRGIILQMGRGELPELQVRTPRNAVGEMMQALGFMINGFKQTSRFAEETGKGNFDYPYQPLSTKDVQGHALLTMRNRLKEAAEADTIRSWTSEGIAKLNKIMRSNADEFSIMLDKTIDLIVDHLEVQQAAIFLIHNDDPRDIHIQLGAYHALNSKILNSKRYELREGLIGQAIASNKMILMDKVADPYFTIDTGMGESKQCSLVIMPLSTSGKVVGAVAIASLTSFRPEQISFLQKMAEPIAANLFTVRANLITSQLLQESTKQAEELAAQEQELRIINNELTKQSQLLKLSEEELKAQQEELKLVNTELHNKALLLEEQNFAVEEARQGLSFKAKQLEQSNKYKSAFLANMSHELRTPLNSILILAKLLADNRNNNLESKEAEHAKIIHKSGSDLLALINDILDLSKIEAGKVELQNEEFQLQHLAEDMHVLFSELAADKQIHFTVEQDPALTTMKSDRMRVEQIIKNLLSNAIKFTSPGGSIEFLISLETNNSTKGKRIAFSVRDSGVGIPEDKQNLIFEAFQQADGSTSRKFGGTGLGLAISKELASLLGGELTLQSKENEGSTFTLYLPINADSNIESTGPDNISVNSALPKNTFKVNDDRELLDSGDQPVLIIEDDYVFARMLLNQCHKEGYKAVIALQGDHGVEYAKKYNPLAVILDMKLPVLDGWGVLKAIKGDEELSHIPVHIISSVDKKQFGLESGASSYIIKPAGKEELNRMFRNLGLKPLKKTVMILDSKPERVSAFKNRLNNETEMEILYSDSIKDCESKIEGKKISCLLMNNSDVSLKESVSSSPSLKEIPTIYTGGSPDECLREIKQAIATEIKQEETIKASPEVYNGDALTRINEILQDKKILVVDDDMRNIYSMTHILETEGANVIAACNGVEALKMLESEPDTDLVLMDIMMPEMNGYECMAAIRNISKFKSLPVIAVTAKALNGDREKCMEAGASDYISKPVKSDELLSLIRLWMVKHR